MHKDYEPLHMQRVVRSEESSGGKILQRHTSQKSLMSTGYVER
jgi:hypothetical protein